MTANVGKTERQGRLDEQGIWDAGAYDSWFGEPRGAELFRLEAHAVLHRLSPLQGLAVLEVGCRTGRFMKAVASEGATAVGVDADPGMVRFANRHGRGEVARANAETLPFRDACFDATVAVTVLEFVNDVATSIEEIARVTRPGGRIVVGFLNPRSAWGLGLLRHRRQEPWRSAHFLQQQALFALLARHGKADISGIPLSGGPASALIRSRSGDLVERFGLERLYGFQVASCTKS